VGLISEITERLALGKLRDLHQTLNTDGAISENYASTEMAVNKPSQVLFASLIGTTIEFFDFYIYATAPLSLAKTPQGLDSGSRNNVTGHSHAYPFQPRFEILTRNRQVGGRYVIDFKDGQNFGEPQP
jgi:hypothetical protein